MVASNHFVSGLPVNLDDLIHCRTVEQQRLEFKACWDEYTKKGIVHSICAFANDLLNANGGYVVLGIEEANGKPVLPPRGIEEAQLDAIQREVMGACKGGISPEYLPAIFSEVFQEQPILVLWAPAGDNRPYQAPCRDERGRCYWVRSGSSSIEARGDILRQLMEGAAKIPFDDRRNMTASLGDISPRLVKRFLENVRSRLAEADLPIEVLLKKLKLTAPVNSHDVPRNVALLFFHETPDVFFSCARIEVVQFGDQGDLVEEKYFEGPLQEQIHSCLVYLDGIGGRLIEKVPRQAEIERTVAYPYEAMEEALVNAIYHRGYDSPPEPVKVYLYPDRMEIISYPGPVPGITLDQLHSGQVPPVPARNRRIGEFLKDLRLAEGRGTGIPKIKRKMLENGSPEARFDFDEGRTYFRVTLPVHPRYKTLHALRESGHLWLIGEKERASALLENAFSDQPSSGVLLSQLMEYAFVLEKFEVATRCLSSFEQQDERTEASLPYLTLARLYVERRRMAEAQAILAKMPSSLSVSDLVEMADLKKRAGDFREGHRLLAEAIAQSPDDAKVIHHFAQMKMRLAKTRKERSAKKRLNREAVELLRRAHQLTDDSTRKAWIWLDLASCLDWLREPRDMVDKAFQKALSLRPDDALFRERYESWIGRQRQR